MTSTSEFASTSPLLTLNDGKKIPQLGFGVYKTPNDEVEAAIECAFEAGYRHIDTAKLYDNEEGVGRAVRNSGLERSSVFVTTKVWNDDHGREKTRRACEESLERLGLDYVDLYLIHWPMPMNGLAVETWEELIRLREEGLVTSIGVANFPAQRIDELTEATGVVPVLNQIELNPYFAQNDLREANRERGVLSEAWAPLHRGKGLFDEPIIREIAERLEATPAQVVLAWHLALGTIAIPKSVTPSRIRENFGALNVRLTPEDLAAIATLDRGEAGRTGFDPETMERGAGYQG
ncbi:aldo/keto reductase [Dermabacter hominis]|uniref:aldo/keto reductase n=1 Tax=Dermabacter hominis TaxID=36740 RepID=UPI00223C0FA6|nr:aldo/keto reductase [Dermabacter hominis]MCT2025401.1 aldo/keto reductase [Dermabacter hominis]MCT2056219.1 aldo/keto reductase [Dermabacter hominis]MCT2083958.1 aldo/keto reductase [Dermabacter hominis]MCT2091711.1 aldo/keto reductase [Dermabacter hominis]MCT2190754.1 aldo/keto reductase [Dermabacter hominis]